MNDELIESQRFSADGKQVLKIFVDSGSDGFGNPRENTNLTTLYINYEKYGDPHEFDDYQDEEERLAIIEKIAVFKLPIFMLKHSGVKISTTSFNDKFDSGLAGIAYITKESLKEYGMEGANDSELKKRIDDEVEEYNTYLDGEVYNYILYENKVCELGHNHLTEIDSSNGYLGDEGIKEILSTNEATDWLDQAPSKVVKNGVEHNDFMGR